ncbi:heparinase [Streptomyces sp. SID5785]|uniref:heparinase II/III domain-containing protein n=1 Tax=Streptomyces sp. SID5785 TaxID=2690309 RepID=UPI001360D452|nr:heparinase II/III family protein [Streptomyces sp. SID5785]MZD05672.1 heparinase [Streptomyces sp. SID5785]
MPGSSRLTDLFPPALVAARMPAIGAWSPVPPAADSDAWSSVGPETRDLVIGSAAATRGQPWPALPASLFARFARDGDRSAYQGPAAARRERLGRAVPAVALATVSAGALPGAAQDLRAGLLDDVLDGVWALCEETSWVLPAHDFRVLGSHGRAPGLLPDPEHPTLDLGASMTAVLLALTDAIVGDELDLIDPLVRRRLRHEVSARVLRPYLERDDWGWYDGSTAKLNNWNPWIHSELLLATALTVESDAVRCALVDRIVQGLDTYLAAQPADGGCDEGPHYWWRAGASVFECLETLTSLLGTGPDVFGLPLVRALAQYPLTTWIGAGWAVNFADGPARPRETWPALLHRYGRRTAQPEVCAHARALRGTADAALPAPDGPFDLRRVTDALFDPDWRSAAPADFPLPAHRWLPDTQVLVSRATSGTERGLLLAAKAGHNDESHNHNDVGSFIVALDARPLIVDAGVGTYRRETFSPERYGIWSMTSEFHNLPVVNGHGQRPGAAFRATDVTHRHDAMLDELAGDIAAAYPPEAGLTHWRRTFRLHRDTAPDGRIEIIDAWECPAPPGALALHLLAGAEVVLAEGGGSAVVTPSAGRGLRLGWDAAAFTASVETVQLSDPAFVRVWGPRIHRLVLTADRPTATGTHTLTVDPAPERM